MNPEKPIVLLHGYFLNKDHTRGDIRTGAQFRTAEILYKRGEISGVFLALGPFHKGEQPFSEIVKKQILKRGKIPSSAIFMPDGKYAITTKREVALFKKTAETSGWDNLADIGNEAHLKRIKTNLKRAFGKKSSAITVWSAEEILETYEHRFSHIIQESRKSSAEKRFKRQEIILNIINSMPFGSNFLEAVATILPRLKIGMESSVMQSGRK